MPGAESWPGPGRAVAYQGDKRCPVASLTPENLLNSEVQDKALCMKGWHQTQEGRDRQAEVGMAVWVDQGIGAWVACWA